MYSDGGGGHGLYMLDATPATDSDIRLDRSLDLHTPNKVLGPLPLEEPLIEPLDKVPGLTALRCAQPNDVRCRKASLSRLQAGTVHSALSREVVEGVRVRVPHEEFVHLRHCGNGP